MDVRNSKGVIFNIEVKTIHMKNIIGKFLCCIGIHKLDEEEWHNNYGWGEEYLHSTNCCVRCNKMVQRKLD